MSRAERQVLMRTETTKKPLERKTKKGWNKTAEIF